jgi:hypothetical protein
MPQETHVLSSFIDYCQKKLADKRGKPSKLKMTNQILTQQCSVGEKMKMMYV